MPEPPQQGRDRWTDRRMNGCSPFSGNTESLCLTSPQQMLGSSFLLLTQGHCSVLQALIKSQKTANALLSIREMQGVLCLQQQTSPSPFPCGAERFNVFSSLSSQG